jgi:predicted small metal-binding protein
MFKISCADMGSSDCNFVATGKTREETKKKMMDHAMFQHADKMKSMSKEDMAKSMKMMDDMLARQKG